MNGNGKKNRNSKMCKNPKMSILKTKSNMLLDKCQLETEATSIRRQLKRNKNFYQIYA